MEENKKVEALDFTYSIENYFVDCKENNSIVAKTIYLKDVEFIELVRKTKAKPLDNIIEYEV